MNKQEALRALCDQLCRLYPEQADATRVAVDASLVEGRIAYHAKPLTYWHHILQEAEKKNRVGAIVNIAAEEYEPQASRLQQNYQIYLEAASQTEPRRQQGLITLLFVFEKHQGKVRLLEIPKLLAQDGLSDMPLNWALTKGANATGRLEWHANWTLPDPGDKSPLQGDAVTLLFDLVEWMVLREIARHGSHMRTAQQRVRPGDDFAELPQTEQLTSRATIYAGLSRPNYFWSVGDPTQEQVLHLPVGATLTLRPLPRRYGVATYGKESVNQLHITTPGGELAVEPSQIWAKASSNQARSLLRKKFPSTPTLYPLEMKLRVTVTLAESVETDSAAGWPLAAYHYWLLELQEQMVRHMDWDRYVEADYRRMVVKLVERLEGKERSQDGPEH